MERHRFGVGEYKYFARPLPARVEALRAALYAPLAAVANRWAEALGESGGFPSSLEPFLERCARGGQTIACTATSTGTSCSRCRSRPS
jgi:hypothetical protein